MDNEMLTTDDVREAFVGKRALIGTDHERQRAAFDRWLAEENRLAAEQAWREGYYTGKRDYAGSVIGGVPISTPNPYSEENIYEERLTRSTLRGLLDNPRIRGSIGSNK